MAELKYLWDNSTSAIFWGFFIAVFITVVVFRLFKDTPPGSRYTPASTFWGLLMVMLLSVECISIIGAFQARLAVSDMEESLKSYGGNALNTINLEETVDAFVPSLKRFIKTENINKGAVDDVVSTYADNVRQDIDKQLLKLGIFVLATLIFLPMFIIKSKRFYDHARNYSAKRSNYRSTRKRY